MECDRGAPRSFFRTSEFDSCGSKQFGPTLMESDCHNLVGRLIEMLPADDAKEMGESGQESKYGCQEAWHQGHYLGQDSSLIGGMRRLPRLAGARPTSRWNESLGGVD